MGFLSHKAKRIIIGNLGIHGFGPYLGESMLKVEMLTEYMGEGISQGATDRGLVYDRHNLNYLFSVSNDMVIDATRTLWMADPFDIFIYCFVSQSLSSTVMVCLFVVANQIGKRNVFVTKIETLAGQFRNKKIFFVLVEIALKYRINIC